MKNSYFQLLCICKFVMTIIQISIYFGNKLTGYLYYVSIFIFSEREIEMLITTWATYFGFYLRNHFII